MKVLFDTNVVLDVLLARGDFAEPARQLMVLVEKKKVRGYLCATTITTIHYLIARQLGAGAALAAIQKLMLLFALADVTRTVIEQALEAGFTDFEDAVLYQSGRENGVEVIVTRNPRDFRPSLLPVYSPQELLALLTAGDSHG